MYMDRVLTGRRIVNSENHLRKLWPFLTQNLAKSCYYVPITPKPEICKRPFSLAEAEKGEWAQAACPSGLRQPDHAKELERRYHVHTCMRGRALDCSHRAWRAHGARRQRWRATWDWLTELGDMFIRTCIHIRIHLYTCIFIFMYSY